MIIIAVKSILVKLKAEKRFSQHKEK